MRLESIATPHAQHGAEKQGQSAGLLGFGGDNNDRYRLRFEGSLTVFLTDALAVDIEYRAKPDNLSVFREDTFKDVFIAWLPSKYVAFTAAYVRLGNIADKHDQDGVYLSLRGKLLTACTTAGARRPRATASHAEQTASQ